MILIERCSLPSVGKGRVGRIIWDEVNQILVAGVALRELEDGRIGNSCYRLLHFSEVGGFALHSLHYLASLYPVFENSYELLTTGLVFEIEGIDAFETVTTTFPDQKIYAIYLASWMILIVSASGFKVFDNIEVN